MTDRPEDRPEERRRRGPLGDDAEETRRVPTNETRADGPPGETSRRTGEEGDAAETRRVSKTSPEGNGEKDTRVIRAPGSGRPDTTADATPYPRGYFEAADEREDRLRDMYGGVDWLASFLGFVFALVAGGVFSLLAGIVLTPLGLSLDLGGEIGAAAITGLVILAVLVFLTYFFGGYVAGRLARFDGGRNGSMLLVWTVVSVALLALAAGVFSSFLPDAAASAIGDSVDNIGAIAQAGTIGLIAAAGALLVALLGGFLGGRLGSRYHSEIDRAT